jgi:branched-chain amino acid aminotransferase
LLIAERENPNAKVIQNSVREKANQLILKHKLYEVLLVNGNGLILEGSRSNVFFVKDEVFYTAPASQILVGITRQKILECLNILDFPIIEEAINASEIDQFDAVFLTGTSPKVLPVRSIGNLIYNTKLPQVTKLIAQYNLLIDLYIQRMHHSEGFSDLKPETEL